MSKKYNLVKKYYDKGLWKIGAVRNAVVKKWITEEEYRAITGEAYEAEGEQCPYRLEKEKKESFRC